MAIVIAQKKRKKRGGACLTAGWVRAKVIENRVERHVTPWLDMEVTSHSYDGL